MELREEWLHILIKRGFSAPGAREILEDLRAVKSELPDEDFGLWLKTLDTSAIPKMLAKHHLGQNTKV